MKTYKFSPTICSFLLLLIGIASIGGCNNNSNNNAILKVINIDPDNDSCTPLNSEFHDCAEACEQNPLGCANDILHHVESEGFINRRQLNPGTIEQKPNLPTPMHGSFVTIWNNPQLNNAINNAIQNPSAPVVMPVWSISEKLNNNPGITNNTDPTHLDWVTVMYKIP